MLMGRLMFPFQCVSTEFCSALEMNIPFSFFDGGIDGSNATASKKPLNQTQLPERLAEGAGIKRWDATSVMVSLTCTIFKEIGKRVPGVSMLPGLFQIKVVVKPARLARKGINPFADEPTVFKPVPPKKAAKILPLAKLKAML